MESIKLKFPEVILIKPSVYYDERGYFFESYQKEKIKELGIPQDFVQDNESLSMKNVIRGLHYQLPPYAQGKLVRVTRGSVIDVVVDIRKNSNTFGKWLSVELSSDNKHQLWIPEGFAHGFISLEDNTVFNYKCTNYYNKESEASVRWNDPEINITWNDFSDIKNEFIISEKDKNAPLLKNARLF